MVHFRLVWSSGQPLLQPNGAIRKNDIYILIFQTEIYEAAVGLCAANFLQCVNCITKPANTVTK